MSKQSASTLFGVEEKNVLGCNSGDWSQVMTMILDFFVFQAWGCGRVGSQSPKLKFC